MKELTMNGTRRGARCERQKLRSGFWTRRYLALCLGAILAMVGFASAGSAQTVTIKNKWTETFLAGDAQGLSQTPDPAAPNAVWMLQSVPGTNFFYIRTTDIGNFLHVDRAGDLRLGSSVDANSPASHWERQDGDGQNHRLRNVGMSDYYINNEQGQVAVSAIQPGWWSAMWNIQPATLPNRATTNGAQPRRPRPNGSQPRQAQTRQGQQIQTPPLQPGGQGQIQRQIQGQDEGQNFDHPAQAAGLIRQQPNTGLASAPPRGQAIVPPQQNRRNNPQQGFANLPPAGSQVEGRPRQ